MTIVQVKYFLVVFVILGLFSCSQQNSSSATNEAEIDEKAISSQIERIFANAQVKQPVTKLRGEVAMEFWEFTADDSGVFTWKPKTGKQKFTLRPRKAKDPSIFQMHFPVKMQDGTNSVVTLRMNGLKKRLSAAEEKVFINLLEERVGELLTKFDGDGVLLNTADTRIWSRKIFQQAQATANINRKFGRLLNSKINPLSGQNFAVKIGKTFGFAAATMALVMVGSTVYQVANGTDGEEIFVDENDDFQFLSDLSDDPESLTHGTEDSEAQEEGE